MNKNASSLEIYHSEDGRIELNVRFQDGTVWLNRQQMAELFGRDYKTIAKHINNALREELEGMSVVANFATPKKYGRRQGSTQTQMVEYYDLEMITSVGFRVKSKRGVEFRKWANNVLKDYLIKGYAVNQQRIDSYNELRGVLRLMSRTIAKKNKEVEESRQVKSGKSELSMTLKLPTLTKVFFSTLMKILAKNLATTEFYAYNCT